ncbi:MAG: XdhC family protein [Flammeovirgaceae bacterium]
MTHEFKKIIDGYQKAQQAGLKAVLATVVDLKGSSYRKPGVRMLLLEDGQMIGAVSGGCVEKEVFRQSEEVFETGKAKMMTYDGRFRLGCEGILYILLEPFEPTDGLFTAFRQCMNERTAFEFISLYDHREGVQVGIGSMVKFAGNQVFAISGKASVADQAAESTLPAFVQQLPPCFKLVIIGAEHDAVQLCLFASLNGWEVTVVHGALETKSLANFPGAHQVLHVDADNLEALQIDEETAVVMMTHNFAKDLTYLATLQHEKMSYIGVLGPIKRREKLIAQLLETNADINTSFLEKLHGPAGLNIGAVTPQEIAISIIAEILAVMRDKTPHKLSELAGPIHAS